MGFKPLSKLFIFVTLLINYFDIDHLETLFCTTMFIYGQSDIFPAVHIL